MWADILLPMITLQTPQVTTVTFTATTCCGHYHVALEQTGPVASTAGSISTCRFASDMALTWQEVSGIHSELVYLCTFSFVPPLYVGFSCSTAPHVTVASRRASAGAHCAPQHPECFQSSTMSLRRASCVCLGGHPAAKVRPPGSRTAGNARSSTTSAEKSQELDTLFG